MGKTKPKLPAWKSVEPANVPDVRVSRESSEWGKRLVPGALGVDEDGQLWVLDADFNARYIGRPPKRDPDQGT